MNIYTLLILVATIGSLYSQERTKCKKKKYFGCFYKQSSHQCLCKTRRACSYPFKYKSERSCMDDMKKIEGACKNFPCKNNGVCIPKGRKLNKFTCNCKKTGFYGKRCHKPCPKATDLTLDWLQQYISYKNLYNTPLVCIM